MIETSVVYTTPLRQTEIQPVESRIPNSDTWLVSYSWQGAEIAVVKGETK